MNTSRLSQVLTAGLIAAGLAGLGHLAWQALHPRPVEITYRTAAVERGPIAASVNASGVVNAVATVHVGSPLPGRVITLHADFNSEVRRGQTLARLDPEPHEMRTAQAQADLEAARGALSALQSGLAALHAQIARTRVASLEAQRDAERKRALAERGFVVAGEAERAEAAHRDALAATRALEAQVAHQEAQVGSARAVLRQREASLAQARTNLERTSIRAPVDGVVISRTVESGQLVGPGGHVSPLFIIARDLRDMQVDMAVGEADVGRLRAGQPATFTVDAFPRRRFEGRVVQVRKAPLRVGDDVIYTAVVTAPNPDLALLPGMTARVSVVTESRDVAVKVPSAALAFRAEAAALGAARTGRVWRLGTDGMLEPVDVALGITDGTVTEVASGDLREGDIIVLSAVAPLAGAIAKGR